MKNKFKKMLELNMHYSKGLSKWAENTENLNDDALLLMLQNLMKEYEMQSDILMKQLKFEKELYRKKRRLEEKDERTELSHQIKKTKFKIKRRKRLNKKLYKLFKKKLKIEFDKEFSDNEKLFDEFLKEFQSQTEAQNNVEASSQTSEGFETEETSCVTPEDVTEEQTSENECQGKGEG